MEGLIASLPPLFILVQYGCITIGAAMLVHATLRLRHTQNKIKNISLGGVFWEIFFAVALINLNAYLAMGTETLFGSTETQIALMSWTQGAGVASLAIKTQSQNTATVLLAFLQFIGYVGFARGIVELNNAAQNKPNASLAKGLTHVIGGILCSNLTLTAAALSATFLGS